MMDFCEEIVRATIAAATGGTTVANTQGEAIDFAQPFERVTILELIRRHAGVELRWDMTLADVRAACPGIGFPSECRNGPDAIMFIMEHDIERHLLRPTFIIEFPKSISPLSKAIPDRPDVADRFELFVNRMELANGFSELNDPRDQYERFAEQVARRRAGDEEAVGRIDEDYVRALEYGMVPAAGIGIGIDRLVMIATRSASIRDVILFPLMKPVHEDAGPGNAVG